MEMYREQNHIQHSGTGRFYINTVDDVLALPEIYGAAVEINYASVFLKNYTKLLYKSVSALLIF